MNNFNYFFLYNFDRICFSIDNYFIPNNFFNFSLNVGNVMMNVYLLNSNDLLYLRNHLFDNLRHRNNMGDFICNVDWQFFLESNRHRHLHWMHYHSIIIHNFHVFNVEVFDSVFKDFNRYFLLLNYNSLVSNFLRLHNCLCLQILDKHFLSHDSLLLDCQVHNPLNLDFDWNLNHAWLFDYPFDGRQLLWNFDYLLYNLLDNLRHFNYFLYNPGNNYNFLHNLFYYFCPWYFYNLFDNLFYSLYLWFNPVVIERNRDSFLLFDKDWSLFFDVMRYSSWNLNRVFFFDDFRLRNRNRDVDFFYDFVYERDIIDLFFNLDHLNE